MLVWPGGQSGTIGGGALEFSAAKAALDVQPGQPRLTRHALGPDLGQCCGGAVWLLSECYDQHALNALDDEVVARPVQETGAAPLSVKRILAAARSTGFAPPAQLIDGWMVEPVYRPTHPVWIWGAGHVGRALVDVLAPLPDLALTWVDTAPDRFPQEVAPGVTVVSAADPGALVPHAPRGAMHLVLTYSHALDLDLCSKLLTHGFSFAGLIGSATKWARFRSRLGDLGHTPEAISRITCPIGDPALGKHPQAIAVGVAGDILRRVVPARENLKDLRA